MIGQNRVLSNNDVHCQKKNMEKLGSQSDSKNAENKSKTLRIFRII